MIILAPHSREHEMGGSFSPKSEGRMFSGTPHAASFFLGGLSRVLPIATRQNKN